MRHVISVKLPINVRVLPVRNLPKKKKKNDNRIEHSSASLPSLEKSFEIIGDRISSVGEIVARETTNSLWIRGETSTRPLRCNYVANYVRRVFSFRIFTPSSEITRHGRLSC